MPSRHTPVRSLALASLALVAVACGGGSDDSGGSKGGSAARTAGGLGADVAVFVDQFTDRIESSPDKATPHGSLGLVYVANDKWSKAFTELNSARELEPSNETWQLYGAQAERALGRLPDALASLRAATTSLPDSAPLHCLLGDVALESGEIDEARKAYMRARELNPQTPEPLVGLAEIELAEGQAETAIQRLEQSLEIDFLYRAAHFLLGKAYQAAGREEDAARELRLGGGGMKRMIPEEGAERLPRFAAGGQEVINESQRRIADGRWQEASALLGPLVARYPENARFRMNFGIASFNLGRQPEGVRALQQAARLEPDYNLIPFNLAGFHLTLEQYEDALREVGKALAMDPAFAPAHVVAGHALIGLGHLDEAEQAVNEARRLDPSLTTVATLEAELAKARAE